MSNSEYKEYGWSNDQPLYYHNELLRCICKLLPKDCGTILDVGCGNGYIANRLLEAGYDVYGIDASHQGVAQANKKNAGRFHVNDVVSAQLPEAIRHIRFGTIISTEVIEHLYSPQKYVEFLRGILDSNGGKYVIVSTPYHGYIKNLAVALTNRYDYHFCPLWEGGHIKFWSRKTLTELFAKNGFRNFAFLGVGHAPFLWKMMLLRSEIQQ